MTNESIMINLSLTPFTHSCPSGALSLTSVIPRLTRDLRYTKGGFKAGRWRVVARHDRNWVWATFWLFCH